MHCTGIILAGGKSARMGTDKGMLWFRDKFLIEYSIESLKPFCNTLLISSGNDDYRMFGYPVIKDVILNKGPVGGIYSCLLESASPVNIVLPCDMPMINAQIIERLVQQASSAQIVVFINTKGEMEPLCGMYNKEVLPFMMDRIIAGKYDLTGLVKSVEHKFLYLDSVDEDYHQELES